MSSEPEDAPSNPGASDQASGHQPPSQGVPIDIQQQAQQALQKMPANFLQMAFSATPMANPLLTKIEPQHITQILTISADHDEREFKTNQRTQLFIFVGFLVMIGLIGLVIFLFRQKPEVLTPLLTGLGGLGSGLLAGIGMGRRQAQK